jgi:hypothetical protein
VKLDAKLDMKVEEIISVIREERVVLSALPTDPPECVSQVTKSTVQVTINRRLSLAVVRPVLSF